MMVARLSGLCDPDVSMCEVVPVAVDGQETLRWVPRALTQTSCVSGLFNPRLGFGVGSC